MSHLLPDMLSVWSIVDNTLGIMGVTIITIATGIGGILRVAYINNYETWNKSNK